LNRRYRPEAIQVAQTSRTKMSSWAFSVLPLRAETSITAFSDLQTFFGSK
jgi:hypothetical protein